MDQKDRSAISDATAVKHENIVQQTSPSYHSLLSLGSNEEIRISCRKTDSTEVSVQTLPVADESSSDAGNRSVIEETLSAGTLSSAVTTEGKGNLHECRETGASEESLSPLKGTKNARDDTKEGNQARDFPVSLHVSAEDMKKFENLGSTLFSNIATRETVPCIGAMQKGEVGGKRDSPFIFSGTLREVDSLLSLSIRNIQMSEGSRRKTRHLSESEVHSVKVPAEQKLVRSPYKSAEFRLQNKDQERNVTQSPVLESGPSDIPQGEAENIVVPAATQPEGEEEGKDNERKAFFYISSSSLPGMKDGSDWEWPSVSGGYQMPSERPIRRVGRQESREPRRCLGTQRCHYIVLVVALLTALIGCIVYHLSDSGIVPDVLRPIGASAAFISFGVCVFSSIYISYLKNYPQLLSVVPNFELLGDVDSVMAMNRTSNPEFVYREDYGTDVPEYYFRQTQSADVLDRRGYGRQAAGTQTEVKRYSDETGTAYSGQPQKRFKAGTGVHLEDVRLIQAEDHVSNDDQTAVEPCIAEEIDDNLAASETSVDAQKAIGPDIGKSACDKQNIDNPNPKL